MASSPLSNRVLALWNLTSFNVSIIIFLAFWYFKFQKGRLHYSRDFCVQHSRFFHTFPWTIWPRNDMVWLFTIITPLLVIIFCMCYSFVILKRRQETRGVCRFMVWGYTPQWFGGRDTKQLLVSYLWSQRKKWRSSCCHLLIQSRLSSDAMIPPIDQLEPLTSSKVKKKHPCRHAHRAVSMMTLNALKSSIKFNHRNIFE